MKNTTTLFAQILVCTLTLLALFSVPEIHASMPAQLGKQAFQDDPKDGLRDCFLRFQEDMIKYEKGELKSADDVFDLMQAPEYINRDRRFTYLLKAARRLFLVTQTLIFDYETDIPDAPADMDTTEVTLYTEDRTAVTFKLVKSAKGIWLFSSETLDSPEILQIYKKLRSRYEKLTRLDMEGDTYDVNLMSPYRTMLTLRAGVMGLYGFNLDTAALTLDLSEIRPAFREALGRTLAVRLYRILHFESPLDVEQLSADPQTETLPVFLVEPGFGAVTMHVVEDENGIKAWKFTPKSLDIVRKTYDDNVLNILAEGDNPFIGEHLPVDILMDDFIQSRFPFLENEIFGVDAWKYVIFLLLLLSTPLLLWIAKKTGNTLMRFLRPRAKSSLDEVPNNRLSVPLMLLAGIYLWIFAFMPLITSEDNAASILQALYVVLVLAKVWLITTVVWIATRWIAANTTSRTAGTITLVVGQVLRIIIIVVGLINIASLFGQDSTRVLAALGIGGVAIALASKNTVENIFGTMMIVVTRPFAIGHFIIINDIEGEVEHVGLRSTTIRTFYNSLVTVPNSHFITSPVDNMGKRKYRRFKTTIGVAYDTPPEKLVAFTEGLRELAHTHPQIDSSRIYINVYDFGASTIDILVYLHLLVANREEELTVRERFILDAIYLADMLNVEYAFPTQTLYMRKEEIPNHEDFGGERRGAVLGREAVSMLLNRHKADVENVSYQNNEEESGVSEESSTD